MEQFTFLRLFSKYWILIIVVTAFFFGAGVWVTSQKPVSSFGSLSITVQAETSYPSNGQLILQSSPIDGVQVVVATTQSWLTDPSFAKQVLGDANISTADYSLKSLASVFTIVSSTPNASNYQVQYVGKNEKEVREVLNSLKSVMEIQKTEYNKKDNISLKISTFYSNPTITNVTPNFSVIPIAGLLSGLIVALVIAALLGRKD